MTIDEEWLHNVRRFESPSSDLADRIILAARMKALAPRMSVTDVLQELLLTLFPRPAFALAAMLTIGVVLGATTPILKNPADNTTTQAYFDDEGTIL